MLIDHRMVLGQSIPIIDRLFSLTYIRNSGIAFGLFNEGSSTLKIALLSIATLLALAFLIWLLSGLDKKDFLGGLSIGMIAGGAVGNLIDRIRLGEVIDFLDFYWGSYHWPAFNVADSSITVGVALLVVKELYILKGKSNGIPGED